MKFKTLILLVLTSISSLGQTALEELPPLPVGQAFSNLNNPTAAFRRYTFNKQGAGAGNVVQGWCVDPYTQEVFTLHLHRNEQAILNRYGDGGRRTITSSHFTQDPSLIVGHQQLNMAYDASGERWFYSALNSNVDTDTNGNNISSYGDYGVRFKLKKDGSNNLLVTDTQLLKFFANNRNQTCTLATSLCGKYLIAEHGRGLQNTIRVFDLSNINAAGDYSDQALYEFSFNFEGTNQPLQGLACDGAFIYVFSGFGLSRGSELEVRVFTLEGELVQYIDSFQVGLNHALNQGAGQDYEMEGASWLYQNGNPTLAVCIASNTAGNRNNSVWSLGGATPNVSYAIGNKPSFISGGANDFGVPAGESARFGHYDAVTDEFTETARFNSTGQWSFSQPVQLTSFDESPSLILKGTQNIGYTKEQGLSFGEYDETSDSYTETGGIDEDGNWNFGEKNKGNWNAYISNSKTPNTGQISPTTAVGTFNRVGDLIFVNVSFSNIDTTGLGTGNLYIHNASEGSGSNFDLLAANDTNVNLHYNDVTLSTNAKQLGAVVESSGMLTVREYFDGRVNVILNCDQLNGSDIRIQGVFTK